MASLWPWHCGIRTVIMKENCYLNLTIKNKTKKKTTNKDSRSSFLWLVLNIWAHISKTHDGTLSFICLVPSMNMFVKTAEVESVGLWAKTGVQPSWITSLLKHHQFHSPDRLTTGVYTPSLLSSMWRLFYNLVLKDFCINLKVDPWGSVEIFKTWIC